MTDADRTDVFRGLAHPLRRRVITRLSEGETAVAELCELLHVSPQSLSRHLAILRETGLVISRRQHAHRFYRLDGDAFQRVRRWISGIKVVSAKRSKR